MDSIKQSRDFFANGGTLAMLTDVGLPERENLYAYAYGLLQSNEPARAAAFFTALTWLDHHEKKYWVGLGVARQASGDHRMAVIAFAKAARCMDADGPVDSRVLRLLAVSLKVLGHKVLPESAGELADRIDLFEDTDHGRCADVSADVRPSGGPVQHE